MSPRRNFNKEIFYLLFKLCKYINKQALEYKKRKSGRKKSESTTFQLTCRKERRNYTLF